MRRFFCFLLYSVSFLMLIPTAWAASTVHEFHLTNGLTLLVKPDDRAPVVLSSIWYKVGGSYEHNGITGISHVLEHMMFKGTKKYGPGVFDKIINRHGGQQNAMTAADFTMYYQKLAANNLSLSFKLEADRMQGLLMQPASFKKELQVVMDERHMRVDDNPRGLMWVRFNAAAYVNNPYHHPIVGWATDIKHLSLQDARRWYQHWYAPNNAVIIVVGKVKPQAVYRLAQKYFGSLQPSTIPPSKPRTEATLMGVRKVVVNAPAKLPILLMGFNVPSLKTAKQKWQAYALFEAAYVLGGGSSSRFTTELIRGQQIAVAASSDYNLFRLHDNLFVVSGIPAATANVGQLGKAFWAQLNRLKKKSGESC